MKQKYSIVKDNKTGDLTIQEYAELSKDLFSLVCEESYKKDNIEKAVSQGDKELIDTLRTPNLYPISDYIAKIAEAVTGLYSKSSGQSAPVELVFDDVDLFKKEEDESETGKEQEDSVEIEDLLEDDTQDKDVPGKDSTDEKTPDKKTPDDK